MRRDLGAIAPGSWLSLESTRARHDRGYTQLDKGSTDRQLGLLPHGAPAWRTPGPSYGYTFHSYGESSGGIWCPAWLPGRDLRHAAGGHDGTSADRAAAQEAAKPQRCNCLSGGNAEKPVKRTY